MDTSNKFLLTKVPPRTPDKAPAYRLRQAVGVMSRDDLINLVAWACAIAEIKADELAPILRDIRGGQAS